MTTRRELLARVGSAQQEAYVRPIVFTEGRATDLPAYLVKNGPLALTLIAGKCLDIAEFSYKGVGFHFLAKPGLMGRGHFDTRGDEALRSIMGGLLFTCGLENICPPCRSGDKDYPMHGRMRTTPAEHLRADARWVDGDYLLTVAGEMREAELFGENLVLRRTVTTKLGERSLRIHDEIENEGFRDEAMMLLYHFNIGHPLLSEHCRVILPSLSVTPRDAISAPHVPDWADMDAPKPNEPEYVFIHELATDGEGNSFAAIFNEELSLGVKLSFNTRFLPRFMQWKSTAAGDYVMAFEPANSRVYGRLDHERAGDLHKLGPFEREVNELEVTVLDGEADLNAVRALRDDLLRRQERG